MAAKKKIIVEEVDAVKEGFEVVDPSLGEKILEEPTKKFVKLLDCEKLNFRKSASMDADIIKVLEGTDKIEVISEDGEWTKVKVDRKNGFVMSKYIQPID